MLIKQSWFSSEIRQCEDGIFSRNSCKRVKGASEFTIFCLLLALLYCIRPSLYEGCLLSLSCSIKHVTNTTYIKGLSKFLIYWQRPRSIIMFAPGRGQENVIYKQRSENAPDSFNSMLTSIFSGIISLSWKTSSLITSDGRECNRDYPPNEGR
jgi:hypothetical protein